MLLVGSMYLPDLCSKQCNECFDMKGKTTTGISMMVLCVHCSCGIVTDFCKPEDSFLNKTIEQSMPKRNAFYAKFDSQIKKLNVNDE